MAARFASAGKTVAIMERDKFGGTCVNTGCTPTKTLVASAYAIHVAGRGAKYGFSIGDLRVDMNQVKARKVAASLPDRIRHPRPSQLKISSPYSRPRRKPLSVYFSRRRHRLVLGVWYAGQDASCVVLAGSFPLLQRSSHP
jgi:hypothetical protein